MPGSSFEVLTLPVLQEAYNGTGNMPTQNYVVNRHFTKRKIEELLKTYHLVTSGTKGEMLDRLRNYALHPERWAENYQAAPMRVRGSTKGSRANGSVAKRTRAMFGDDDNDHANMHPCKRAVTGMMRGRTEAEIKEQQDLAKVCLARMKQLKEHEVVKRVVEKNLTAAEPSMQEPTDDELIAFVTDFHLRFDLQPLPRREEAATLLPQTADLRADIQAVKCAIDALTHHVLQNAHGLAPATAATLTQVPQDENGSHAITTTPAGMPAVAGVICAGAGSTFVNVSDSIDAPPIKANTVPKANGTRQLTIDGIVLTFDPSTVGDPPQGLAYSGDRLEQLFAEWYNSAHIVIDSHPIAIRYWNRIFVARAGLKKNAWKKFRSTWHNWKVSRSSSR
ncbi:hypothetical protein NM688_g7756 [Phlebia brevispora]|uniref:Uncharacterized protein n=1 Tax=Phlebia brevispora TaxID=194682 RepID=A0ACC1S1H7_9APHY|nr:hypothetical protein NM688_g7756 [Phlebia brevispora]